jgi:hypothetical protein
MNRSPRTSPYTIEYGKNINCEKEKACDLNNDSETIESFRERNSILIFGGKERQLKHYPISEMCQPGLPGFI